MGANMKKTRKWVGEKFGRLLVVAVAKKGTRTKPKMLLCRCSCGNMTTVAHTSLHTGATKSCGCLLREFAGNINKTHAMSKTKEYRCWTRMKNRCTNKNAKDYKYYGGRGISVCKEWRRFENFFKDMGAVPPGMEIDRIDNEKNYSKENCRWTTHKENCNNFRRNRCVTIAGTTASLSEWEGLAGIPQNRLRHRLNSGWPEEHLLLPKFGPNDLKSRLR